eukprot:3988164-Prymnesium_polylepis.1
MEATRRSTPAAAVRSRRVSRARAPTTLPTARCPTCGRVPAQPRPPAPCWPAAPSSSPRRA